MQLSGAPSAWQAPGPEFHHWYKKKKVVLKIVTRITFNSGERKGDE